ncbi:MAG: succinate--CoA ligase subunit alpha [Anaerolineaceae bacterium]|nr:succinate--CoA ligase subunit alpha [Anaerolineaceae bacterium]
MSILVNDKTHLIVQGITGKYGTYYSRANKEYGTWIIAGVSPGKGGIFINDIPVFDTVQEAKNKFKIDASIIWVPGPYAKEAIFEAIDANISIIVVPVDGIPVKDAMQITHKLKYSDSILIGPNTPGIISPGKFTAGFMPTHAFSPGYVGIASRSGTLTYQTASLLTEAGIGQSTALGIGGDPIVGFGFIQALKHFENDLDTSVIVLICEIGGNQEELAAEYIKENITKPVIAFISGKMARPGTKMGHAGAIISGNFGSFESKLKAFNKYNIPVAELLTEIPTMVAKVLKKGNA